MGRKKVNPRRADRRRQGGIEVSLFGKAESGSVVGFCLLLRNNNRLIHVYLRVTKPFTRLASRWSAGKENGTPAACGVKANSYSWDGTEKG